MATSRFSLALPGLVLALLPLCLPRAANAEMLGWRRDGTGVFPETQPVLRFDSRTGGNILWRTPMPSWSNSSPIVVGRKVLVMSEPTDWAPLLLCLDADTGREGWRVEVDHLDAAFGEKAPELRKQLSETHARERAKNRARALRAEADQVRSGDPETRFWPAAKPRTSAAEAAGRAPAGDAAAADRMQAEAEAQARKLGCTLVHKDFMKALPMWTLKDDNAAHRQAVGQLRRLGLGFFMWSLGDDYVHQTFAGYGFPTPVSDGQRVFVFTGFNSASAYDLDGRLLWTRWYGKVSGGHFGCWHFTNPLLADGLLLFADCNGGFVRAIRPETGEVAWEKAVQGYSGYSPHTPAVVRLDGKAYLFHPGGNVFRVCDGELLASGLGASGRPAGSPCVLGNRVFYDCGPPKVTNGANHTQALELALDPTATLRFVKLWRQDRLSLSEFNNEGVAHAGKLYGLGQVVEAASGNVLGRIPGPVGGKDARRDKIGYGMPYSLVGGKYLVYGGKGGFEGLNREGAFWIADIEQMKLAGEGYLANAEPDEAKRDWIRQVSATDAWRTFGNGSPYFAHGRMYVRAFDWLYCVGEK